MADEIQVQFELQGWSLFFARLERSVGFDSELAALRAASAERVRQRLELQALASDPTVAALRQLFRAAGCDPTRYRPSSEALIRRILKGASYPPSIRWSTSTTVCRWSWRCLAV